MCKVKWTPIFLVCEHPGLAPPLLHMVIAAISELKTLNYNQILQQSVQIKFHNLQEKNTAFFFVCPVNATFSLLQAES